MLSTNVILIGIAIIGFGLLLVVISIFLLRRDNVTERLLEYVAEQSDQRTRPRISFIATPREITGSLISRTFIPMMRTLGRILGGLTPTRVIEEYGRMLNLAGNPFGIGAREYYGITMGLLFIGIMIALVLFFIRGLNQLTIIIATLSVFIPYEIPRLWLRNRARTRQGKIRKGLPDALDMLSVCTTAGLGFDQSLQRIYDYWDTPIGVEFGRVISEMEMGVSRRDALRNFAERVDISELSNFVAVMIQADQLGVSISDTLLAQAEQMRIERRFRAQEQAQKLPTKMLIPVVFFIFPALLAVILGPSVPILIEVFRVVR